VSRSAAVRARAARIVAQVAHEGRSLDALLAAEQSATAQERGLLRSLCYDSIRWYIRLDALLAQLLAKPNQPLASEIRALCIVGLCQLLYSDVPAHAAVDETVNATRALKQPRAAGLVNAILRRCQRDGITFGHGLDRHPSTRTAHPSWLVRAVEADWGEAAMDRILDANNERPPFWLRVNRRKVSGVEYRRKLTDAGHEIASAQDDDHTIKLARPVDVHELPGFTEGLVSVQDAAAQLAARLLDARAGERVLDGCAAPGGKTCHILEVQPELSELVAVDVSKERLVRVEQNLQRLGLSAQVIEGDAAQPASWWNGQPFERILLDVPCSATGVVRRHPDIKLLRRMEDIAVLAQRQAELLAAAWPMLRPGGRLVYASCSILRVETSDVVNAFLANTPDARDVTRQALQRCSQLECAARDMPGHAIATGTEDMDGFYYACVEKHKG
jgi:16S rRNA (cytosine967-C5)-methyltransferase